MGYDDDQDIYSKHWQVSVEMPQEEAVNQARERKRADLVRGDVPGFVFCSEE